MPRQQPESLASVSSLRGAASTLRSAVKENLPDALEKIASAAANAFEGAQTAIEGLESRLRRLGEPNVFDPIHRTQLLVSGDRIRDGINVQGPLGTVRGQSLDLTFENQVGRIASYDHIAGAYLPLILQGAGISPPAGVPGSLPPGAAYLSWIPPLVANTLAAPNPPGSSALTWTMLGLGFRFTASNTRGLFIIDGQIGNSDNGGETDLSLTYGTGPNPVNGGPRTGTVVGQPVRFIAASGGGAYTPFSKTFLLTGLVPGTDYWVDIAVRVSRGTSALSEVQLTGVEIPNPSGYYVLTVV